MFGEHWDLSVIEESDVILNENNVEHKPRIIDKVRSLSSQFSYTVVRMNINLLAVVTPPYIYH